jgi:hypothetical protein
MQCYLINQNQHINTAAIHDPELVMFVFVDIGSVSE